MGKSWLYGAAALALTAGAAAAQTTYSTTTQSTTVAPPPIAVPQPAPQAMPVAPLMPGQEVTRTDRTIDSSGASTERTQSYRGGYGGAQEYTTHTQTTTPGETTTTRRSTTTTIER